MCEKCIRRSKRLGTPKGKFGMVKFFAHQALKKPFGDIPLFEDRRLNIAIEAHIHRILQAKIKYRRNYG